MKKIILFFIFLSTLPAISQTTISMDEVKQAGLCIVEIITNNGEEPQSETIESPIFPGVYNLKYKNKVPCRIIISKNGYTLYDSDEYVKNSSGATIRINGNTTAYFSDSLNMPYKLKLEKAADLLCRENNNKYKDKEWRLLKDAVSLNTIIGLKISQLLDLEWTSDYTPCNVIINGDYRGCYLLMETMKRNEACRINCDKQTGYIIEKDPYWWKEDKYFSSNWYKDNNVYRWSWKYPDADDVNYEQQVYIKEYIESTEESLSNGNFESFINITSFAKWILVHDILGTKDSWGSNMFIKKFDNTNNSKLELPCVWDFDSSYKITPGSFSPLHTQENEYFSKLFNSDNRAFINMYIDLWNKNKKFILDEITTFLVQYNSSDEAKALDNSRQLYNKRFGYSFTTVSNDILLTQQWFNNHLYSLDKNIQILSTNIEKIPYINSKYNKYYNLSGIAIIKNNKRQIIITKSKDGKKVKMIK